LLNLGRLREADAAIEEGIKVCSNYPGNDRLWIKHVQLLQSKRRLGSYLGNLPESGCGGPIK
jgi:hypothetical protein